MPKDDTSAKQPQRQERAAAQGPASEDSAHFAATFSAAAHSAAKGSAATGSGPAAPFLDPMVLSGDMAVRLWLDHFSSYTIPLGPKEGPKFESADAVVEKMLEDGTDMLPAAATGREIYIPTDEELAEHEESGIVGEGDIVPGWMDGLPHVSSEKLLAAVVTDSGLRRKDAGPSLMTIISGDPEAFADITGKCLNSLLEAIN